MKKILLLSVCALFLLSSCNSFLEEKPKSTLTLDDFNKTEAHFLGQANYLYRHGAILCISNAGTAYIGPFSTVPEMLTGYYRNSYEGQENVCQYSRLLTRQEQTNTVSSTMDNVWDDCYDAINVANSIINNIDNSDVDIDATNAAIYMAEAKFFRAFNYFYLVKTFGGVPLSLTAYTSGDQEMRLERSNVSDIYAQIVQDLKDAISVLPSSTWQDNSHRVTRYVADQVLASVYMQEQDYADALPLLREIINSGKYALTENTDRALNSAYNQLRTTDDLGEVIYAVEYDNTVNTSGWWPTYAFSSSATGVFDKYAITERVYGPIKRFLNIYTDSDLRGQEKQFFATSYTNPVTKKTWTAPDENNFGCWYFFDENAMEVTGRGTKDWNIYRYAETLLDAAECIAQTSGVTAEAAGYLAQIQSRALGESVAVLASSLEGLSKQNFIEACWTERLREFPLEMKIWDQCLRTGKFPNISTTAKGKVTYETLVGATNGAGATIKSSDLLWPISLNEIQRNPKLTQNEGYASSNK